MKVSFSNLEQQLPVRAKRVKPSKEHVDAVVEVTNSPPRKERKLAVKEKNKEAAEKEKDPVIEKAPSRVGTRRTREQSVPKVYLQINTATRLCMHHHLLVILLRH